MNPIVAERKQDLARLCEEHRVARLDVFGSAVTGEFDPETSDLDFLVTFQEATTGKDAFDKRIGLQDALEGLFGRKVDVIPERSITNPYFRANVEDTRDPVYPNSDSAAREPADMDMIMRRRRLSYLNRIVELGERMQVFTAGKTLDVYLEDEGLRLIVERLFELIGETLAQMARRCPNTAERITDYRKIISFRNFLIHRYWEIIDEEVWTHVVEDLPTLLREARALLAECEDE